MPDRFGHEWKTAENRRHFYISECQHCGARMTSSDQGSVQTDGPTFCPSSQPPEGHTRPCAPAS
jgi:hypothetical protein